MNSIALWLIFSVSLLTLFSMIFIFIYVFYLNKKIKNFVDNYEILKIVEAIKAFEKNKYVVDIKKITNQIIAIKENIEKLKNDKES